jgi:hypothetical protein
VDNAEVVKTAGGEWNTKPSELIAPRSPGRMVLWAVVRDNRGGTAWLRQSILVTDN